MKIIDQSHKLQSSGHCCVCAGVCLHIWPTHLCARHERMETNRREGMVSTLSADDATIRGDNEMLRAERDELRAALAEANLKLEAVKAKVDDGLKASVWQPQNQCEAHYLGTLIDLRAALTEAGGNGA